MATVVKEPINCNEICDIHLYQIVSNLWKMDVVTITLWRVILYNYSSYILYIGPDWGYVSHGVKCRFINISETKPKRYFIKWQLINIHDARRPEEFHEIRIENWI